MPRIDKNAYEQAEEKQGGGFVQPQPGAYVLKIQAVRTEWEEMNFKTGLRETHTAASDNCVLFVYDIDEGEFDGEYSRDFYMKDGQLDPSKDFMHQVKYGWWDMGRLKLFNNVLIDCNPGFQPMPALENDQWNLFVGRRFGAVLNGTVTTNDNGFDNWRLRCGDIITIKDVHDGNHAEPKITDKRKKGSGGGASSTPAAAQPTDELYDDIPFNV